MRGAYSVNSGGRSGERGRRAAEARRARRAARHERGGFVGGARCGVRRAARNEWKTARGTGAPCGGSARRVISEGVSGAVRALKKGRGGERGAVQRKRAVRGARLVVSEGVRGRYEARRTARGA